MSAAAPPEDMHRSHVVSWNLTRKCNLRCEHCYIGAGRITRADAQGELTTDEALAVVDQLCEVNPEALLILTGGEPLLRKDVFEIASYASSRGLWPVVGTNGVLITAELCERMLEAGIRGVALSLDSLDPEAHDRFRQVEGAFQNTVDGAKILEEAGVPFIVQTTIGEHNIDDLADIAAMAFGLGARVFNVYFLVPTGRGSYISTITSEQYEEAMGMLQTLQKEYVGRMVVNSKCAPHYQRFLYQSEPDSPFLKTFGADAGGCPAGTHYVGIRPNGDVTPCPYLPVYGGNLREQSFKEIWEDAEIFQRIRRRDQLTGHCGTCEFSKVCGGCRARAYGASGDVMATDEWCEYTPGAYDFQPITFADKTTYGLDAADTLVWSDEAREHLTRVPSFVRGQVSRRIESVARERGLTEITPELMHEVRQAAMGGRVGNVPSFLRKLMQGRE
ncbi:MAG: radical SAM protein [Myxococcota bacterium]|nr:radical SAM protein [Myxococcota bacterium]